MPRNRLQTASKIASTSVTQVASVFDALPEKPKETYSLREAVSLLYQPIRTALSRGYSYSEITAILATQGIPISAFSLKRYLSLSKREQTNQLKQMQQSVPAKQRRGRKSQGTLVVSPEAVEAATDEPESVPTPKRRGRTGQTAAKPKPVQNPSQIRKGRGRK